MKYRAIFIASLVSSQIFAESRIESIKKLYDNENYQEAQEIIKEILVEEELEGERNQEQENLQMDDVEHEEESYGNEEDRVEKDNEENSEEQTEEKLFALFFDGLINIKLNDPVKAEESFSKIVELKNDWEQIYEVYYWLGQINFLLKRYSKGLDFLNLVKEKTLAGEIDNLIQYFFSGKVDDIELNRCVCKNPENDFIAKKWLNRQTQLSFSDQYIWLLQHFFSKREYQDYKKYFFNKVRINKKEKYNLAIILPLDLEKCPKNSHFYDFYNLFSLALEEHPYKEKFQIFIYDAKKDGEGLEEILQYEELKNMDVIVNTSKKSLTRVSEFSRENEILLYDFSSKNLSSIQDNDFAFLTRASEETYSLGAAKFILNELREKEKNQNERNKNLKNVTVAYVEEDYKNAEIFKNYFNFNKIQVNEISLSKEDLRNLLYNVRINLNTIKKEKLKKEAEERKRQEELRKQEEEGESQDYEEVNNEETPERQIEKKEEKETEKLEVIKILEESDYVFLASDNIVLLGNMIGIIEQCKVDPKIFCDYDLLNSDLAEEIFNKENIFYITANKFGYEDVNFINFKEKYFNLFKKYPSLEMFYDYNAIQKVLNNLAKQKVNLIHDEQNLMFINF